MKNPKVGAAVPWLSWSPRRWGRNCAACATGTWSTPARVPSRFEHLAGHRTAGSRCSRRRRRSLWPSVWVGVFGGRRRASLRQLRWWTIRRPSPRRWWRGMMVGNDEAAVPANREGLSSEMRPLGNVTLVVNSEDGTTRELELPVFPLEARFTNWLMNADPGVPPEVQRALHQLGYQVRRDRRRRARRHVRPPPFVCPHGTGRDHSGCHTVVPIAVGRSAILWSPVHRRRADFFQTRMRRMTNMIWHTARSSGTFFLLCTLGFVAPRWMRCARREGPPNTPRRRAEV